MCAPSRKKWGRTTQRKLRELPKELPKLGPPLRSKPKLARLGETDVPGPSCREAGRALKGRLLSHSREGVPQPTAPEVPFTQKTVAPTPDEIMGDGWGRQ
jgi:hypothetical protein